MSGGFSFLFMNWQNRYSRPFLTMDDGMSPNRSRESSPCYEISYENSSRRYSTTPTSIAELSQHFDRHTLTPRRPTIARDYPTSLARDQSQSLHSASSFSNRVCRQRQSLNRLQCSSAHLSRISALVEDMVQTGLPTYDPVHPHSRLDDSSTSPSLSPDEQQPPNGASYFGFTPLPSTSATASASAQHSLRHSQSYKIDKELRHSASREGVGSGGQRMVKKKIRMRKSSKNLVKGTARRRERDD